MIIKYTCPSCNRTKAFATIQKGPVVCSNCKTEMTTSKTKIAIEVMTSEEARFIGDEALFNTVGDRISGRYRTK